MDTIKLTFTSRDRKKLNLVFIIEDSPAEMEMAKEYFSKFSGVNVKGFTSGEACIKELVLKNEVPELILIDYFLDSKDSASKDGLEILVKLKELCPRTDIIMLSGVENARVIELARKKGAAYYVVKGANGFRKLDSIMEQEFITESN